jgi:NSS family neurotransmitter:Na+ symporter
MQSSSRGSFTSRFGATVAVGGSVVGLGNIWRFPYLAGENGGAAFIVVYIFMSLFIAVPIMLSELSIGRRARLGLHGAMEKLAPRTPWRYTGTLGVVTALVIVSFYCVVAGWALNFLGRSVVNGFAGQTPAEITGSLQLFINSGWRPVVWMTVFLGLTSGIVYFGVEKGIERFNKILMPLLVLMLIGLGVNSFFLDGFREGITFVLKPDFSKINGSVMFEALGQAFFSLSIGMGCMTVYGSYVKKNESLPRIAGTVAVSDVCIAILSGIAIFPAVFTFGINPTSGPELVFMTLPNIFGQMPGGYWISIAFFAILFMAAITSSVSLVEAIVAWLSEEFRMSRRRALALATGTVFALGALCAVSQMEGSRLRVWGMDIFDLFDRASSTVLMPLGAFLIVIFAGWVVDKAMLRAELTSDGHFARRLFVPLRFMIKWVCPVVIALLFLNQIGLI